MDCDITPEGDIGNWLKMLKTKMTLHMFSGLDSIYMLSFLSDFKMPWKTYEIY